MRIEKDETFSNSSPETLLGITEINKPGKSKKTKHEDNFPKDVRFANFEDCSGSLFNHIHKIMVS